MKWLTILAILVLACGSTLAVSMQPNLSAAAAKPEDLRVPGMLQVQYTAQAIAQFSMQKSQTGVAELGIASLDAIHRDVAVSAVLGQPYTPRNKTLASSLGLDRFYTIEFPSDVDLDLLMQRLAADPNVESVSPVVRFVEAAIPTDPNYAAHWGHNNTVQLPGYDWGGSWNHTLAGVGTFGFDANAQVGWDSPQGYGAAGITIAIIDSGVDVDHTDYNYVGGWDFISGDANPDEAANAHGTACAGVAAARANNGIGAAGAAPGCGIMGLRTSNNVHVTAALMYAADNGAEVISMSFSFVGFGPGSLPDVEGGLAYAAAADLVQLAASGNENASSFSLPAVDPNVMAIGAASPCGGRKRSSSNPAELNPGVVADPNSYTCDGERWWGSNYGANVQNGATAIDLIGPTILPTTDILGAGGYQPGNYEPFFNGTSCATPYVAGVAALVRSLHPTWTAIEVRARLRATAIDIVDVDAGAGWDRKTGYGMVDAAKALALPDGRPYGPGGWPDVFMLSDVAGTTFDVGAYPAVLPGDGTTYTSWQYANVGTDVLVNPNNRGYRDGVLIYNAAGGNWAPGWRFGNLDITNSFTGGRHTVRTHIDPDLLIQELNETNNAYARQFAWTPVDLAANTMVTRAAPPNGQADWSVLSSSGNPIEFNNDSLGFKRNLAAGYWRAMATHSTNNAAAQDYDIGLMNPTFNVFTGNDNASWTGIQSLNPGGILDAVLVNGNLDGLDYETTLWNQFGTGTVSNIVEHRVSPLSAASFYHGDLGAVETFTLAANQMIEMRELWTGAQTQLLITMQVNGAVQPVKLATLDHTFQRGSLADASFTATSNAAGKASINLPTTAARFYGIVVYRDPIDGSGPVTVTLTIRGPLNLTVVSTGPGVSSFNLPNGTGNSANAAQQFGGALVDATVTATITNSVTGTPQAGIPATDVRWFIPGVTDCDPLGLPADAATDAAGYTEFTSFRRSGGTGNANTLTVLNAPSVTYLPSGSAFRHNSADINGDLLVNLLDVSTFSVDLTGVYNYRSDFRWDGVIDLLDVTRLAPALATGCAAPKVEAAAELARAGKLGIYFDGDASVSSGSVEPNQDITAYVVAHGEAARLGIAAWEGRLEATENVQVQELQLGERALNLGQGTEYVVGFGGDVRQSDAGAVVLASFQLRVTDNAPARIHLVGALGAELPAVVVGLDGDDARLFAMDVNDVGGATATLNGGSGPQIGDAPGFVFTSYRLSNHPNPFNPATEISFALPKPGDAVVRIFDVSGRLVRELPGGVLPAGEHTLRWNGTDHRGAGVVSGVYYYKLFVDRAEVGSTKSMLLLK